MSKRSFALLAGAVGAIALTGTAHAGSQVLGDSGWTAMWADGAGGNSVSISTPDAVTADAVYVEKFISYTSNAPVTVLFQQTSPNAVPYIVINDEQLVNHSGSAWTSFTMQLVGSAAFDPAKSNVGQSGGFDVSPFSNGSFSADNTILTIDGGGSISSEVPNNVWFPGAGPGELWAIAATGDEGNLASFSLVETPATAIPVPAAVWSGLSGLLALGAVSMGKRLRRLA